jgi:dihydrofolate reductase
VTIKGNIKEEILKIENQNPDKIVWVIGGAELLEQCDGIFDRLYITHIKGSYKIDTKLNLRTFLNGWNPVQGSAPSNSICTFVIYENIFKRSKSSID